MAFPIHFSEARGTSEKAKNKPLTTYTRFQLKLVWFKPVGPEKASHLGVEQVGKAHLRLVPAKEPNAG